MLQKRLKPEFFFQPATPHCIRTSSIVSPSTASIWYRHSLANASQWPHSDQKSRSAWLTPHAYRLKAKQGFGTRKSGASFSASIQAGGKTGERRISLSALALEILSRRRARSDVTAMSGLFVFPAARGEGHAIGLRRAFTKVRASANLEGLRIHDLRHSFASFACRGWRQLIPNWQAARARQRARNRTIRPLVERPASGRGEPNWPLVGEEWTNSAALLSAVGHNQFGAIIPELTEGIQGGASSSESTWNQTIPGGIHG